MNRWKLKVMAIALAAVMAVAGPASVSMTAYAEPSLTEEESGSQAESGQESSDNTLSELKEESSSGDESSNLETEAVTDPDQSADSDSDSTATASSDEVSDSSAGSSDEAEQIVPSEEQTGSEGQKPAASSDRESGSQSEDRTAEESSGISSDVEKVETEEIEKTSTDDETELAGDEDTKADSAVETTEETTEEIEEEETEEKSEEEPEETEETAMPALEREITTPAGVKVMISAEEGTFKEGTSVTVTDIDREEAMDAAWDVAEEEIIVDAVAVDITFRNADGDIVEPADGKNVHVTLIPKESIEGEKLSVIHIDEEGSAEKVEETRYMSAGEVSFDAPSFTIYAVIGADNDMPATLTYRFYDDKGTLLDDYTQMVKEGDTLYEPDVPVSSQAGNQIFSGWFEEGADLPFDEFGLVGPVAADEEIKLYAKFSPKVMIFFHDINDAIIYAMEADPNSSVSIAPDYPSINPGSITKAHMGWTKTKGTDTDVSGTMNVGTENIDLYPIVKDGCWVTFESNGGTAYVSQFIPADASPRTAKDPGTPIKKGYKFNGWYADEELTETFDFSKDVTENTTVYAGYGAAESSYLVRYYVEYQSGKEPERTAIQDGLKWTFSDGVAGAWDYKLIARKSYTGITGEMTEFEEDLIFDEPYDQQKAAYVVNTEKTVSQEILADGTTVMDVYYDAKEFTLTFKFPSVYRASIKNDVTVTDTVKYTANLDYIWDVIYSYNSDSYEVLAPNRRFVWTYSGGSAFIASREEMPTLQQPSDQTWGIGGKNVDNKRYRSWRETLEGKDPEGNPGVANQSARVRIGTVTDDRTYYLYGEDSFYAGWNGAISSAPDSNRGFDCRGDYSDGNYVKYKDTSARYPGYTMVWFHAHTPAANNWTYYNLYNRRTSVSEPELQYEYNVGRKFANFNVWNEDDGYLDIYYFRNSYALRFHENGGEDLEDQSVPYEKNLSVYEPDGYVADETTYTSSDGRQFVFRGWFTDAAMAEDTRFDGFDVTMPYYDLDLYAKWEATTYTVTFDSNGGSEVSPVTGLEYGESCARPKDPERAEYDFIGWALDGKPYNFSSPVNRNLTLVAQWKQSKTYGVVYDLNGGKGKKPTDTNKYYEGAGVPVKELPAGVKGPEDTPVFLGWVADSDGELYYPNSIAEMPAKQLKLTAQWGEKEKTTVYKLYYNFEPIYEASGVPFTYSGDKFFEIEVKNNERITLPDTLAVPEGISSKFVFEGWYKESSCANGPVTAIQVDKNEEEKNCLYAKWSRTYKITYKTNGGLWKDTETGEDRSETHSVTESGVRIAAAPTRKDYRFIRWEGSSYQPGDLYAEHDEDGFFGDDVLVAVWEPIQSPPVHNDSSNNSSTTQPSQTTLTGDATPMPELSALASASNMSGGSRTGDDSNAGIALAVSLASLAGIVAWFVLFFRRKRADEQ